MRLAFNGHFWGQPRTGSGQYLRHLWDALLDLPPDAGPPDSMLMLLNQVPSPDEPVPGGATGRVVQPLSSEFLHGPLHGRSGNLDKLLWEQSVVPRLAAREGVHLLHVPYLGAPFRKTTPTVVTAHDLIPWVVPGYRGGLAMQLYLRLSAAGARRADLIVTDSDASRRDAINLLRVPPGRVRTVYLGMEPHPDYTPEQQAEVRSRLGLPKAYAFYLGGFDSRKRVPLLLRAWRKVVDSLAEADGEPPVLAIGGDVPQPGGIFPDVMSAARSLGFDGDAGPVRFLERVSERDKGLLMSAARLFVYPSIYEGFGFDPLEAMSVGCPVISTSGGSLSEVVGNGGILVPPDDEVALSVAIIRAWGDEALRMELRERGRARAQSFTWRRTAEQTCRLYAAVMRRAGGQYE